MISIKNFVPRVYQQSILETSKQKNTLVCLPTGTGKTKSAILLAVHRLRLFPECKVLVCSPTKPLSNQIYEEFKECTTINPAVINLLTGAKRADERKKLWSCSSVIVATPQTIQSDIEHGRITLEDVCMLCLDECHRSKERFANTVLARYYRTQGKHQRVLALTASPGGTTEKIRGICTNLNIEAVEIRSEEDPELKQYIQEKEAEYVNVELPEVITRVRDKIMGVYKSKVSKLGAFGLRKPAQVVNKKDLLLLQLQLRKDINKGNRAAFTGISIVAQAIKVGHAAELLETQSVMAARNFLEKLKQENTRAAKIIMQDQSIQSAEKDLDALIDNGVKHPKMERVVSIVSKELRRNPSGKAIVFVNFRGTVSEVVDALKGVDHVKPVKLIGQKDGLSQKEQIGVLKKFEDGVYNCLVGTQILEEGLDVKGGAEVAIFYDPGSGSEIRKIQRSGRVGRMKPGKVIFLIAKHTRDEAYFWSAHRKEKKMKQMLYAMKKQQEEQSTLGV